MVLQDRGTLKGIAATLLALSLLAERAAGRSLPVRFLVLAILGRAETFARAFVARSMATLIAEAIEAGCDCPDWPYPDLLAPDEPSAPHYGAAEAHLLALRLRILAALLGMLAGEDGDRDDRSQAAAGRSPANAAPRLPVMLVLRLPAIRFRRPSRPP